MILAVIGPSGSGKTTLCNAVKDKVGMVEILSMTTRPMRAGERQNSPYRFVTEEEFDVTEKIESVVYSGNKYGIPKSEVDTKIKLPLSYIIVSIEGYEQLKHLYGEKNVKGVYIKVGENQLVKRMEARGSNHAQVTERMQNYFKTREWEAADKVEYIFNNDAEKEQAVTEFGEFIKEVVNANR